MKKLLLLISFLIPIVAMSQQKTIFSPAFTENKTLPDTIIKIHDDDLDSVELATQYRLNLKEDKANKENTTVDNNTTKYPTVNLLKAYADTKAPLFSGTTGFIPKFIGTNTIGNSGIWTDGVYGFGLNTSTPNYLNPIRGSLDLNGSEQALISLSIGGVGKALFFHTGTDLLYTNEAAGNMGFNTNGARRVTITQTGNVDVGYDGNRGEKFSVNGNAYINTTLTIGGLASTNPELLSHSSDGTITKITDGTNGQFLKTNGTGGYAFSTLPIASSTVTGTVKVDGTTIVSTDGVISVSTAGTGWNHTYQPLSGTTITYDVSNGINANLTLSGNTTVNMSNVQAGMVGSITIINDATIRTITFSGYTFKISLAIRNSTNSAYSSGSSRIDKFTWDYDGTRLSITGEYNLQ